MNGSFRHGDIVESVFRPPFGLANPHIQTLLGGLWPARRRVPIQRERWELPDGDFVDIDWCGENGAATWALVLPGLLGSLASPYAVRLLNRLALSGYRAGLLNYRGLSGTPNRLTTAYHAGFTRDLDRVAHHLAARYGSGIVAGFSMGGNLLLKWLGERGSDAPVHAAAAVSAPFRLASAVDSLSYGKTKAYGKYLTHHMQRIVRRKFAQARSPAPPPIVTLQTLRDFDEHVTAPLHGFADADEYYAKASCFDYLRRISVPTLIINALDDPLIPRATLPTAADLSPTVTLELSTCGGHLGFLGRNRSALPCFSTNERLMAFFADRL